MRAFCISVTLLVGTLWLLHAKGFAHEYQKDVDAQRSSLDATSKLVEGKLEDKRRAMLGRIRAYYKLHRSTWPRLWMEPETRGEAVRYLGAARRVVLRDVRELDILKQELMLSREGMHSIPDLREVKKAPRKRSLHRPIRRGKIVGEFGNYRDRGSHATLFRRGVELLAQAGRTVHAPAAGSVRYLGEIAGIGQSVILDHGDYWTVLGRIRDPEVRSGQSFRSGARLGEASGPTLYFELRLAVGERGVVVDPTRLLHR